MIDRLVATYNAKDLEGLSDLYHEHVTLWSSVGVDASGREEVVSHIGDLFRRLPDEQMTVDVVVTDGDTVVLEITSRGTAKGGSYEISFTEVLEVADGRVSSIKTYIDPQDVAVAEG